jgi:hypothetical protein
MEHPIEIDCRDQISKVKRPGVRRSLPYQGIARRAITNPPQPVEYDTEIDVSAVVLAFEHDVINIDDRDNIGTDSHLNRVFGRRVTVPEFELYANPTIKISEVKRRRFNVIDRGSSV